MARLGEHIPRLLLERGIDIAFGVPGFSTLEIYRGLQGSGLRHFAPRHEQGAGFMADGYARATGNAAACFASAGPGTANLAAALRQAQNCSIPMLVLCAKDVADRAGVADPQMTTRTQAEGERRANGFSRWTRLIGAPEDLPAALDDAVYQFRMGRPGPVVLDIPTDLLTTEVGAFAADPVKPEPPEGPSAAEFAEIVMRLETTKAPLLVLGGGAVGMGVENAVALAELLVAPVMLTSNARGLLPPEHPLLFTGCLATAPARRLIADADAVFAIGTEFSPREWGPDPLPFRTDALIRMDIDSAQLSANATPAVGVVGDASRAAPHLLKSLAQREAARPDLSGARAEADALMAQRLSRFRPLMESIWAHLPQCIVVGDVTEPAIFGMKAMTAPGPRRWWTAASGFAAPGYALPAAIGAKLGAPRRPVVAVIGDGGALYTLPEIAAAVEARTPIVMIVWNNNGHAGLRDAMSAARIRVEHAEPMAVDFHALARGFGAAYQRVSAPEFLREGLRAAIARTTPTLLELRDEYWFG